MAGIGRSSTPEAGRQKGTPNKRTQDARDLLDSLGCDPLEGMARIALDEDRDIELRARMYAELAQYVYPKRKAIELKDESSGASDFLQLRALLEHYRNWRRAQGLPEIGALPDKCPTEPYISSGAWDEEPAESAPAPAGRAAQTNGATLRNGKQTDE